MVQTTAAVKYPNRPKEIFCTLKFLDPSICDSESLVFEAESHIKENIKQTGLKSLAEMWLWGRCDLKP